jgi:hypothetical protein
MAYFPLLQRLTIERYGLFPGANRQGNFDVIFRDGLTLILGANGLGKTTLVMMLFRMIVGTVDVPLPEGRIGNTDLKVQNLDSWSRRQFAQRVNDGARDALARLHFQLGGRRFSVERRLTDLELQTLTIDDVAADPTEAAYQAAIILAADLGSFADWVLVLRTLVFFFEDRRALVWDPGAQRQLLRALLLSPADAQEWTRRERVILELDSRMRNLQSALRREEKERNKAVQQMTNAPGVRAALAAAETRLAQLHQEHARIVQRIEITEMSRHRARLDALRAQADQDTALRELERARLLAIDAQLPNADESIRFILARLMSDQTCLVCGTGGVHAKRVALEAALEAHRCVVCDSLLAAPIDDGVIKITDERLRLLKENVDKLDVQVAEQTRVRDEANDEHLKATTQLAACVLERDETDEKVHALMLQLPPDQRRVTEQQKKFDAVASMIEDRRAELRVARTDFAEFLGAHRAQISQFAEAIKIKFTEAARGFLFEDSQLTWFPTRTQVGQAGADGVEPVEYPAFAVDLTGSDFAGLKRRDDPAEVSESQREFIDLAFRMALVHVASPESAATIVIDAPESSLDAVFVDRAAVVLGRFAGKDEGTTNRLIVTSNLGAGQLVAKLLQQIAAPADPMSPIVDLFHAGVPTRAMVEWHDQYEALWDQLRRDVSGYDGL